MKKFLSLIICLFLLVFSLTSCDIIAEFLDNSLHQHEYPDQWMYDDTHHWLECDCGDIINSFAHTGGTATATEAAVCEICGQKYGEKLANGNDTNTDNSDTNNDNNNGNSNIGDVTANKKTFTDKLTDNGPMTESALVSIGNPKVLVIPVNLDSAYKSQSILDDINTAFTGTSVQTGWESVNSYYQKASYGRLNIEFEVLNEWFTPRYNETYYLNYYNEDTGDDGSALLLEEAITYYDSRIDFSDYDSDGDDIVDAVWLVYNCPVDYDSDDTIYWAYQSWYLGDKVCDQMEFYYYAFAGIDFMYEVDTAYPNEHIAVDAHTYIHETGHLLGLDDYYDYDTSPSVGVYGGLYMADMMDGNIGDHNSASKLLLGWIDPIVISGSKGSIDIELDSFTTSGQVILISSHNIDSIYDEYFLIEFYTNEGLNENDQPVYSTNGSEIYGVRILHVDASICYDKDGEVTTNPGGAYDTGFKYDNSDTEYLFLDTMCKENPLDYDLDYATEVILYTDSTVDFGRDVYSDYEYHDGTPLNFILEVLEMDNDTASLRITMK